MYDIPPRLSIAVPGQRPGSPAARAGIERGDIILEINGKAAETVRQFGEEMGRAEPDKGVLLCVRKQDRKPFLPFRLSD